MTFSGRNLASGGFSDADNQVLSQLLQQAQQETGTNNNGRFLQNIRQSSDYQELEDLRRNIEAKRAQVGNAGLSTEERQQLSQIQNRQRELRNADARANQQARRRNRQAVPQSLDQLEISPRQAEALIQLGFEPTAQGLIEAAAEEKLQIIGVETGRKFDWQGELGGLKQVDRRSLVDREGDNAARMQNFGGVVGEGNRAKEGKELLAVQERADAEYARGEQDWDAKREKRQGTFRMPPRDGREGARPLGIDGFVAEQINLGNVDVPYGAQRGDAMHQAAVQEEREGRASRLQKSVEKGFAVDTDDLVGEGFKAQDFGMERMDDKQIKLNRDFQRKILNEDGSQAIDSQGRKRFEGAREDNSGVDRNFRDVNVLGNAGASPVLDAIARLENGINDGSLDPNMPLDYQNFGEELNRVNPVRKGPTPNQAADAEFRAREVLGRTATDADWTGNLRRDVAFGREARRPEQQALEQANRAAVIGDSQNRTVGQLLQDLKEQVDGSAGVAAERQEGRRAVRKADQAARGQLDSSQRQAVIDRVQREANQGRRNPSQPFGQDVNPGMDAVEVERLRREKIDADRQVAGLRQVFAVDNEGGRQKNVQEMMLKQALEQAGRTNQSVPKFGEANAAPAEFFDSQQRAAMDQALQDRAPQAGRDFNNRRLVNDAKAGIEVVNVQLNALNRAARRKGSPLTTDERQRVLGALTQEIYPNQQIKSVSGKARFGRELVKGNFDNNLESFDYNVAFEPSVGQAAPRYDAAGNVVGFNDAANGQALGAQSGTFDSDAQQWRFPSGERALDELTPGAKAARSWAEGAVFDGFDIQNGDTFDENWPRQAVGQPLGSVASKLRAVGFEGDIKNMDDLGRAFEMFVQAKGAPQRFDPERGAKVTVSDPNVGDMLDALHLSANEKKEFARAIVIQQQALDLNAGNVNDKAAFLIGNEDGRNRALRIEGTKRRAVQNAEAIRGTALSPNERRDVEIQAMKQLAPVQQAARDATMNVVGGADFADGVKVGKNGKIVNNRVGIAAQLRALDPVARVNQAIEDEIQGLEFARGERLSPNERLGVRQVLEQQNGIGELDEWAADARKPFIGAIGPDNKGGRAPREGANVQAGVMRVNINDDDAAIRQELADRAARQRGNRGPRIFEIQGRRNLRDAVIADQAAAGIQQPVFRGDQVSPERPALPEDLAAFGNQNRQMVDRWQGMEFDNDSPMLVERLSPREARERRIIDEQRAQGITGPVSPNPNLEQVNAFDLRNRQVNDPAGMQRGGFNNGPFVGEGNTVPMLRPVNDRIDNMANQIIGRDAAPVIMPRSQTTGVGRMPVASQAPAQFATSQQAAGTPNVASGSELLAPTARQQPKPSWTNPRGNAPDPWTSSDTPEEGITRELTKRTGGGRKQRALPYGIQTSGPSQDVYRPIGDDIKNQLAELNSGFTEQGPRPSANRRDPGIEPDGPSGDTFGRRRAVRNRARTQRFGRGAAVAGGIGAAIAGADGLIGGERERREEEQAAAYMR